MSYDFGSQTLGIVNPFKTEGKFRALTGVLLMLAGVIPLISVADALKEEAITGYAYAILGFIFVAAGARHLGVGIFQLFRYFVGRSVPTSLAYNHSRSEQDVAQAEKSTVFYNDKTLHSMLMGRKNNTFAEPIGWVARLLHSLVPSLTFLPYQVRHLAQEMGVLVLNYLTAIMCFLIVFFVVSSGLAGEIARYLTMPMLSLLLLIYLVSTWRKTANSIHNQGNLHLKPSRGASVGVLLALSIIVPVFVGFALDNTGIDPKEVQELTESSPLFKAWGNLGVLLLAVVMVVVGVIPNLKSRLRSVTPRTEVSEFRDNMQESVHPNEIFINIENIVLANRRYKEIPNRLYREFDPRLNEQAEGKGSFAGELLVETQPVPADNDTPLYSKSGKLLASGLAQLATLVGFGFLYLLGTNIVELLLFLQNNEWSVKPALLLEGMSQINGIIFAFFAWLTFQAAGRILNNASHIFWGEIQFTSLLMFLKTEGTYTESRISTGMSIHDSTRSENVVVRSSITPWILTSRLNTSIFATSGSANLESPRFIMGMSRNDSELDEIVKEIKAFLRGRETIASITNESDLQNASTIHQVNQQTRAVPVQETQNEKLTAKQTEEAAGFLRNEENKDD